MSTFMKIILHLLDDLDKKIDAGDVALDLSQNKYDGSTAIPNDTLPPNTKGVVLINQRYFIHNGYADELLVYSADRKFYDVEVVIDEPSGEVKGESKVISLDSVLEKYSFEKLARAILRVLEKGW